MTIVLDAYSDLSVDEIIAPICSPDDFAQAWEAFTPRPPVRFGRWCVDNMVNNEGRPYDHRAYPHITAPGGPADAVDDHRVRTITLQFGTRLAKSFTGESMFQFFARQRPAPMLLASEVRERTEALMHRMYEQCYHRAPLRESLLYWDERHHKDTQIVFRECMIYGGWAKSVGSLADRNCCYGWANEIDKPGWHPASTTKEGSQIKLFEERFKDFQGVRKILFESTPTVKGASEVERRRLSGWNCSLYVPCPHCKKYQMLRLGERDAQWKIDRSVPGRLEWEYTYGRDNKPNTSREHARATAHYICVSGKCDPIRDDHRAWMMRRAVWAPEGCGVDDKKSLAAAERWSEALESASVTSGHPEHAGELWNGWSNADWITGTPARNGQDASYGPVSSLYALSLTWGDFASEYVGSIGPGKSGDFRNFINGWCGETWELVRHQQDWESLAKRLIDNETPRWKIPKWASMVTIGVDRQKEHFVYVVLAWGPERRCHVVAYGEDESLKSLRAEVLGKYYEHADGGTPLQSDMTLMDNGYKPDTLVEDFAIGCTESGLQVWTCKGASTQQDGEYVIRYLGENSSKPGMAYFMVDTIRTQNWIEGVLYTLRAGDPGSATIHAGTTSDHQDFCEQVVNDAALLTIDNSNCDKEVWERMDMKVPNDFRDAWRYGYVAMLASTRGAAIRARASELPKVQKMVALTGDRHERYL